MPSSAIRDVESLELPSREELPISSEQQSSSLWQGRKVSWHWSQYLNVIGFSWSSFQGLYYYLNQSLLFTPTLFLFPVIYFVNFFVIKAFRPQKHFEESLLQQKQINTDLQREVIILKAQNKKLLDTANFLALQIKKADQINRLFLRRIGQKERQLHEIIDQLETAGRKLTEYEGLITKYKELSSQFSTQVENFSNESSDLKGAILDYRSNLKQLENTRERMESKILDFRRGIKTYEKENQSLQVKLEAFQKLLTQFKTNHCLKKLSSPSQVFSSASQSSSTSSQVTNYHFNEQSVFDSGLSILNTFDDVPSDQVDPESLEVILDSEIIPLDSKDTQDPEERVDQTFLGLEQSTRQLIGTMHELKDQLLSLNLEGWRELVPFLAPLLRLLSEDTNTIHTHDQ